MTIFWSGQFIFLWMKLPCSDPFFAPTNSVSRFPLLPGQGYFILESVTLKRCVTVDPSNVVLEDCGRPTRRMLWKWVSRHRLFNMGSSMCLGLNILDTTQPLGMFECDSNHPVLWWRCLGNMLYGASEWKVTVSGRLVVVKKSIYHEWKRHDTPREGPCSHPHEGNLKVGHTIYIKYYICLLMNMFDLQKSTLSWEMHVDILVFFLLITTTDGMLNAQLRAVRIISTGAPLLIAMICLKDGASVRLKVAWKFPHQHLIQRCTGLVTSPS